MRPQDPRLKAGPASGPGGGQSRGFPLGPADLSAAPHAVPGTRGSLLGTRPVCHIGYRDYFIHSHADPEPPHLTERLAWSRPPRPWRARFSTPRGAPRLASLLLTFHLQGLCCVAAALAREQAASVGVLPPAFTSPPGEERWQQEGASLPPHSDLQEGARSKAAQPPAPYCTAGF